MSEDTKDYQVSRESLEVDASRPSPLEESLLKKKIFFRGYFVGKKMPLSLKALDLALKFHTGTRKCGAPESSHVIEIVSYSLSLLEEKVSPYTLDVIVASCFLHDLIEDYPGKYSFAELFLEFGSDVEAIVSSVTKKPTFSKSSSDYEEYYGEIAKSPLSIIVKSSDRIHNMSTMLGVFSREKTRNYMYEVEDFILPMIKKGRKDYPEFYMIFQALSGTLKRECEFVRRYLDLTPEL